MRTKFQGISNIIRFNWHFYFMAFLGVLGLRLLQQLLPFNANMMIDILCFGIIITALISLAASYYIYDVSNLYQLDFAPDNQASISVANINAGFDETSVLLQQKYPNAQLHVFDFYDKTKHTEVSIERARKAYLPFPNTQKMQTNYIPLKDNSMDFVFLILAAHEIRNNNERALFFKEIRRIIKTDGSIFVVEHLRDLPNFLAYTIGFYHFLSKKTWVQTFLEANITIRQETKITPFVHVFKLQINGISS